MEEIIQIEKMLSAKEAGKEVLKEVKQYEYQERSLFSVHLAMHKIPTYKAAAFDPDINRAWVLNMGYECLEDFNRDWNDIRSGKLPSEPRLNVAVNSLFDPTDAPEGKSAGLIRVFAPYDVDGKGAGQWDVLKGVYSHRCIKKWQQHCDDFTHAHIFEAKPYTPLDVSSKLINIVRGD